MNALRKTSVPKSRTDYKRESSPSPTLTRTAAKMLVLRDTRLSDGAFRLYELLDDYAGGDSTALASQATYASTLARTVRQIQIWLKELIDAGYIRQTVRTPRRCGYLPFWRDANVCSGQSKVIRNPPQSDANACSDHHLIEEPVLVEPVEMSPAAPVEIVRRKGKPCKQCRQQRWEVSGSQARCLGCKRMEYAWNI